MGGGPLMAGSGAAYLISIDGVIDPITADFIGRSIEAATADQAELLLIQLRTPGGLGLSMDQITAKILGSRVPVIVYVGPGGAKAASAGFFILLSADIAAMAPATNTGAAHPILSAGGFPVISDSAQTIVDKITNDAAASLRSIAKRRGRNADLAEQGVRQSRSYTETEALEGGLIDLIARDERELLEKVDGRKVVLASGREMVLHSKGVTLKQIPMSFRQRFWSFIANPVIAVLLLIGGIILLLVEYNNPGFVAPGVVGGICLILSFLGMQILPINYVGILLILMAFGLFLAEIKVGGFGIIGLGGVITMVLGLLMLIDTSRSEVGGISVRDAIIIVVPFAILFMLLLRLAVSAARSPVITGPQGMVGLVGTAQSDIAPTGKVFVRGEFWNATSVTQIGKGQKVRVRKVENLTLDVEEVRDPPIC